jgi:cobyrinic acid a,c-diamide synthase
LSPRFSTGLILAAPSSGSGKTTVTLGLLRALAQSGHAVRGAKSGPDYIDPKFHEAACGAPCLNLDAWAMSPARLTDLAQGPGLLLVEGAMGLFDGAANNTGATADLAQILGLPVVLVIDCARMAQSVAPLVAGFAAHDPEVQIAGLILNRVGSDRHERLLRRALQPLGIPVLGSLPRQADLVHPSRHLGLVQAQERTDLDAFLDRVAALVRDRIDLDALRACARSLPDPTETKPPPPPAQRIAIAQDQAFAFCYPHLLQDWQSAGAELQFFSPLANQAAPPADLIYLPGGYPELHAGRLAANATFMASIQNCSSDTTVYGECGGYMVLGDGLTDAQGQRHQMLGLLRLETSFAERKLHLGYRKLTPQGGPFTQPLMGHEFHYASTLMAQGQPLYDVQDAEGQSLPAMGLQHDRVSGSFAHLIDAAH